MSTESGSSRRLVVIGVGHRDRADDGVGPAVVEALGRRFENVVTLVREGDLAVLPLLWEPDDDVVIVDVIVSAGPVGELSEIDPDHLELSSGMSTHGLNVADAVQLARRLDRMPTRLRVFGIGGREFGYGPISPYLQRLLDSLTEELAALVGLSDEAI
jgi:hydrogenase maturation protease